MTAPRTGGVRIVHVTARSGIVVIPNLLRPYQGGGLVCPTCQTLHPVKTYHINVNADGAAIVSAGVFDGLTQAGAFINEFIVDAHVANPPKQIIGADRHKFEELRQRDKIALWHD